MSPTQHSSAKSTTYALIRNHPLVRYSSHLVLKTKEGFVFSISNFKIYKIENDYFIYIRGYVGENDHLVNQVKSFGVC